MCPLCEQEWKYKEGGNGSCQENICVGNKGGSTVTADYGFSIFQDLPADHRTCDARDQHLGADPYTLKSACHTLGDIVPDKCAEDGHTAKVSAHHKEGAEKYRHGGAGQEKQNISHQQTDQRDHTAEAVTPPVIHLAPQGGDHRGHDNGWRHDQHIVLHTKGHLIVDDQIRHKDLDGDIENDEGDQSPVQLFVFCDGFRTEAVNDPTKIGALCLGDPGLFDDKEAKNTHTGYQCADDGIDQRPGIGLVQVEKHKSAEDHKDADQGHHCIDTLRSAPVLPVHRVGQPSVEGCIIGGRAEEGHQAIQDDGQTDAHCRSRAGKGKGLADQVLPEQHERENGDAPQNVAAADKELPLSESVRQRTHKNGGQGGGNGRGSYHSGNIRRRGVKDLIDKYIEVHILHDPGHLAHQAEEGQRKPKAPA